jgi:DNA-binding transcriptional MerR regulator
MLEGSEFLEYLELQDSLDMVTKSELLDSVRARGARVTDRQLTTYISEGLVPRSARIGSRSGAFPKIVIDVLLWVDSCRQRGVPLEAIRELVPLYKFLKRAVRTKELDFTEFEYVARQFVRSPEAGYAVPGLIEWCLPCPVHETDALTSIRFKMKGGDIVDPAVDRFIPLSFTLYDSEDDEWFERSSYRYAIPLGFDHHREDIVLGLPIGQDVPHRPEGVGLGHGGSSREPGLGDEEEVYATEGG